jgi:hypothetical protein
MLPPLTKRKVSNLNTLHNNPVAAVPTSLRPFSDGLPVKIDAGELNSSSSPTGRMPSSTIRCATSVFPAAVLWLTFNARRVAANARSFSVAPNGGARSGAGCLNRKSVRRNRAELVVLEGLKTQLMAPELVEEFIRGFHEELNRQNLANELQKAHHQTELLRTTRRLKGLCDAIADGLRSPGLNEQLLELEARQTELSRLVQSAPVPAPRFHPKLAEVYRTTVADLHAALDNPEARTEAAEILRGLVERITVRADAQGHVLEITGDIVKLLALPGDTVPSPFESSVRWLRGHASTET